MEPGYVVEEVKISEIFLDWDFNCRGKVYPSDVVDLAKDIEKNGLQSPITVQPYDLKPPFKFRCVVGHRRCMAFKVNNAKTIPAFIKTFSDNIDAHKYNLKENLHRVDLNIIQEARALQPYIDANWPEKEIAEEFEKSTTWVRIRRTLVKLPEDIQTEVLAGILTQDHVIRLGRMKSRQEQYEFVRKVKDAKLDLDKKIETPLKEARKIKPYDRKHRNPSEIYAVNERLLNLFGASLVTRALAWAAGAITDVDFELDIRKHCEEEGHEYETPDNLKRLLGV